MYTNNTTWYSEYHIQQMNSEGEKVVKAMTAAEKGLPTEKIFTGEKISRRAAADYEKAFAAGLNPTAIFKEFHAEIAAAEKNRRATQTADNTRRRAQAIADGIIPEYMPTGLNKFDLIILSYRSFCKNKCYPKGKSIIAGSPADFRRKNISGYLVWLYYQYKNNGYSAEKAYNAVITAAADFGDTDIAEQLQNSTAAVCGICIDKEYNENGEKTKLSTTIENYAKPWLHVPFTAELLQYQRQDIEKAIFATLHDYYDRLVRRAYSLSDEQIAQTAAPSIDVLEKHAYFADNSDRLYYDSLDENEQKIVQILCNSTSRRAAAADMGIAETTMRRKCTKIAEKVEKERRRRIAEKTAAEIVIDTKTAEKRKKAKNGYTEYMDKRNAIPSILW